MPSRSETNSAPTGGAADVFNGPRPHSLLKSSTGDVDAEWRSKNTRYNRNSGPNFNVCLPRTLVKLPTNACTSDDAAPSPDSDPLSCVIEPMRIFGTADSFGNSPTNSGAKPR